MIARLIDDWLSNANERAYQSPFAHALAGQGFEVVHVSRHCGMELGKDVLARDSRGLHCAFQLKDVGGKKISLSHWTRELGTQITTLVETAIVHPSLPLSRKPHRSFVVINGELEEEVNHWIDAFNRARPKRGPHGALEVITKGTMIAWITTLNSSFWPRPLTEIKPLVQLWVDDGDGQLNKQFLASVLDQVLDLNAPKPRLFSKRTLARLIHSAAITTSFAVSSFTRKKNYYAEFEAWVMTYAYCCALVEKRRQSYASAAKSLEVIEQMLWNSVGLLVEEAHSNTDLCQGDPFTDSKLVRIRATGVVAVASLAALRAIEPQSRDREVSERARALIERHRKKVWLWGEAACPALLALFVYERCLRGDLSSDVVLRQVIEGLISVASNQDLARQFGHVYQSFEDVYFPEKDPEEENERSSKTNFQSRCAKAFWHFLIQENWKQQAAVLWPELSKITIEEFTPAASWMGYLWRSPKGLLREIIQPRRQSWATLIVEARKYDAGAVPRAFRERPILLLAFLFVYPHRWSTDAVKWFAASQIATCDTHGQ